MNKRLKLVLVVLLSFVCVFGGLLSACQSTAQGNTENDSAYGKNTKPQYANGNVPMTDLAATYDGKATDADGNLLAPFDVVYPEQFKSGKYDYDKTAALLKFAKGYDGSLTSDLKACGFASVKKVSDCADGGAWYRAAVADGGSVTVAVKKARSIDKIVMADYDYIYKSESADPVSEVSSSGEASANGLIDDVLNNVQVRDQWYLTACSIQKAWRFLQSNGVSAGGIPSVTVAVIDTGVDYTHPDLKANMWINDGEIPGNGIDDDGDGYIDDVYGCSTVSDERFHSGDPMDDHGHGTHVAGIIAAANNLVGTVGVAYNTKIMAIKAGQATGVFLQSDIAEAITYAYTHGADVINMSFGGSACSIAVQDALQQAYTTSTLVASAGNDGSPNEATDYYLALPNYPAALSYVVGVMSVNALGVESSFTNWDVEKYNSIEYELYAPGEVMLSTLPNGRYGKLNGTSMAAPVVSGIAALLRSYYTDRDMYPSKFISAQLSATSGDLATCFNPAKHAVNGKAHNLPMIVNAYDALTKLPKPEVTLYGDYVFDDEAFSEKNNGDGVVDAGETIHIGTILRNRWGMSKDTVITIDASSDLVVDNPYVEILTASADFGGVGTYSAKDNLTRSDNGAITGAENPLVVKISDDCPNDYIINLNVTITYKNGLDEDDRTDYVSCGTINFAVRNGVVLPSQITENMTLTKDNYYIIPNSTVIAEGVTVTAEAGTKIQFWSNDAEDPYADQYIAYLQVEGKFITNGTEEEPVELFPSELMSEYEVCLDQIDEGLIDLHYTTVTNATLNINSADHCTFKQNHIGKAIYGRRIRNGKIETGAIRFHYRKIDFTESSSVARCFNIKKATNSVFYKLGTSNGDILSPCLIGSYMSCMFVDSSIFYFMYGDNTTERNSIVSYNDYKNCVFEGNNTEDESGIIGRSVALLSQSHSGRFNENAILNNYNHTNIEHWLRITASNKTESDMIDSLDISNNYWGTTNADLIARQIIDYDDFKNLLKLNYTPYLTTAPENTFPFVVDAYVLNSNGERARTVSNETCTFVVEFNRDMDTSVPLRLRFGSSTPYAEYEIPGEYVTPRMWQGTYTLKTTIENGNQYFNIDNARAADDHFMKLYETLGRFGFEIDTTAAQAMIMQGEATETGVKLSWQQDDFDTLLGYNVYRSDKEDGLYTRLNDYVLAADETTFFDDTVEPGKLYYYNFTVVKTDLGESTPSGKIVIRAMDTMAPNVYHSPVRTAYTGKNLVISATVTDNLQITEARLFYRVKDGEWKSTAMYNNNSRYYGIVGAEYITTDGLEYYIDATDGVTHTCSGSAENPYFVTVKVAVDMNSMGDVDGDGVITNKDALMLLQAANDLLNLTEEQFMRADLNGDGELSAVEAMKILQYVSGKITSVLD